MSEFTFDIPATWKTQADRWAGLFGVPACIAGGALRDLDIGVPHKDVDIFLSVAEVPEYDDMGSRLRSEGGAVILDRQYMCLEARPNRITQEVGQVWEYRVGDETYNLIFLTQRFTPVEFYARLDFGMSRISWWTDDRVVRSHVSYDADKEAKEFRIRRCENRDQLDRSTLRGQRIIKRSYPDYDLVLPKVAELPLKEDL